MTRRCSGTILMPAVFLALAAVAVQPAPAQQAPFPPIRVSSRYIVKAERAGDLTSAIKEYNAILKKMNWPTTYSVWRSQSGPAELIRVSYYEKWADLDKTMAQDPKAKEYQADLTRLTQRINQCFESATREIESVDRQASTSRPAEPPKMLMVWTAHAKSGKLQEVIQAERSEYAPAAKATGAKSYVFCTARYGALSNQVRSTMSLDGWADIDTPNPVRKVMGDEKYRAFTEKMNALLEDYRYDVYRLDPDLTYVAGK
jgi:hypothetical protein